MTTQELNFEVYCDTPGAGDPDRPDIFAVLTGPGPDTPRGTLARVQEAVDAHDWELTPGDAVDEAGTVTYDPDAGDIESVEVTADAADLQEAA